jgi:hypothetical protein
MSAELNRPTFWTELSRDETTAVACLKLNKSFVSFYIPQTQRYQQPRGQKHSWMELYLHSYIILHGVALG